MATWADDADELPPPIVPAPANANAVTANAEKTSSANARKTSGYVPPHLRNRDSRDGASARGGGSHHGASTTRTRGRDRARWCARDVMDSEEIHAR